MAAEPAQGLRARGKEERRRALVEAARALLSEGSGNFSMAVLAARAGVSLVTPYNLFGSKAAILHAVFQAEIGGLHRTLRANTADPLGEMLVIADILAGVFARRPTFYRNLSRSLGALGPEELRQLILPLGETILDPAVMALDRAGLLRPLVPVAVVAAQVARAADSVIGQWVAMEWDPPRLAVEMRIAIVMLLLGVVVESARPILEDALRNSVAQSPAAEPQAGRSRAAAGDRLREGV